jgi:hypothetical protein
METSKTKELGFPQLGFFAWLYGMYGAHVQGTYEQISNTTGGRLSLSAVRVYLLALEQAGYLSIENRGKWHQVYNLNTDKLKSLFNVV